MMRVSNKGVIPDSRTGTIAAMDVRGGSLFVATWPQEIDKFSAETLEANRSSFKLPNELVGVLVMATQPDASHVFVATMMPSRVLMLDTVSMTEVGSRLELQTEEGYSKAMALDSTGSHLYVASYVHSYSGSTTYVGTQAYVIKVGATDISARKARASIRGAGSRIQAMVMDSADEYLYVGTTPG
jgi:hypothetical protein